VSIKVSRTTSGVGPTPIIETDSQDERDEQDLRDEIAALWADWERAGWPIEA
jgi:hypothetical protein